MRNIGKTIGELHALLIEYEKGLPKKVATLQVLTIQGGRIHKPNKKLQATKGELYVGQAIYTLGQVIYMLVRRVIRWSVELYVGQAIYTLGQAIYTIGQAIYTLGQANYTLGQAIYMHRRVRTGDLYAFAWLNYTLCLGDLNTSLGPVVPVNETFHEQTDDELTKKELKQEIWLHVQQMMKGSDIGIQEKKAKLFNEWERFTSTNRESIESYYHPDYTQMYDFLKYNQKEVDELRAERLAKIEDPLALMANFNNPFNYPVFHPDLPSSNPAAAINMALVLMAKAFKLNYSTPTNNNQRISSNPQNRQIAQPSMNLGQDNQMQMVGGNRGNQFR
ncbi:hypothetical protein Tco_0554148 [Tanacetum coccineum]